MQLRSLTLAVVSISMLASPAAQAGGYPIDTPGRLLVMNKSDHTVTLIALNTGGTLTTLATGTEPHEGAVSPDGRIAVIANTDYNSNQGHTLTVVDVAARKVTGEIELGYANPHGIMFMPDGKRVIVTVEGSSAIALVDIEAGKVVQGISTPGYPCHMVVPAPDGRRAYATSIWRGALVVLDLEKGEMIEAIETGGGAEGFDLSPDGGEVWVGNRAEDSVSIIDTRTLEIVETVKAEGFPIRLKFAQEGAVALVSCATGGTVRVFDAASRKELGAIDMETGSAPIGILVAPDQRHAFVANTRANTVAVIDTKEMKRVAIIEAGATPDGMALSAAK
jgi:YVTN family beta-propeller protein